MGGKRQARGAKQFYGALVAHGYRELNPDAAAARGAADPMDTHVAEFLRRRESGESVSIRRFCGEHRLSQKQFENRLRAAAAEVVEAGPEDTVAAPERAHSYYARPDIQQALFLWSRNRRFAFSWRGQVFRDGFRRPEDVALLAAARGGARPAFHAGVGRYDGERLVAFELVPEADHKGDWRRCFREVRPLVHALHDSGRTFLVKFSGHSSAHVVVPCRGQNYAGAARTFLSRLKRIRKLDLSFHRAQHFLRMPYAIHEGTGLVSLPILPDAFDDFDPEMARPENVGPAHLDYLEAVLAADNLPWLENGG